MIMKYKKKKNVKKYSDVKIGIVFLITGLYSTQKTMRGISKECSVYLIAIGAFLLLLRLVITFGTYGCKRKKLLKATIDDITEMDGVTFEDCCIEHFKRMGYQALPTTKTGDYGADIILKKAGVKTVVQCKRYKSNVGVSAVQEVIGAKGYYKADKALVITNSYYTKNAITLALANNVELWNRDDVIKKFKIK